MPILYLSLCVGSGKDVPGLEVVVLRPPKYVRKRCFGLIADRISQTLLLDIEDLDSAILAGYITAEVPAARYLSWTSNLTE